MMENLRSQTEAALRELLEAARLREGDVLVVGCSSSEAAGQKIGTASSLEIAEAILEGILPLLEERGILLAAQCCEHLNRQQNPPFLQKRENPLQDGDRKSVV